MAVGCLNIKERVETRKLVNDFMNNAQCEMMVLFIHVAHPKAGLAAKIMQIIKFRELADSVYRRRISFNCSGGVEKFHFSPRGDRT